MKKVFCSLCFILTVLIGCNLAVDFPAQKGNGQVRLFVSDGTIQPSALLRGVCGFPVIADLTDSSVKELDLTVRSATGEMQYSKKDGNLKYDATSIMLDPLPAGAYTFTLKIVNTFATYEAKGDGDIPGSSDIVLTVNKVTPHIVLYSDNPRGLDAFYFAPNPENSKTVYKVEGLSFKETSSDPQKQLFTFDRQGRFYYMGTGGKLVCLSNPDLSCVTQGAFCIDTTNNRLYSSQYNNNRKVEIEMSTVEQNTIVTSDPAMQPNNPNVVQFFSCLCYFDDCLRSSTSGGVNYSEKRYIAGYHIRGTGASRVPTVMLYCTTVFNNSSPDIKITGAWDLGNNNARSDIAYDIAMVKNGDDDIKIFVLMHNGSTAPNIPAAFTGMGYLKVELKFGYPSDTYTITGTSTNEPIIADYPLEGGRAKEKIYGSRFLGHRGTKLYIAGKGTDAGHIIVFDYANGTKKKISVTDFKDENGNPVTITF